MTGYAGQEHITAADQAAFHVAMFGNSQVVLDRGNKLAASIVTNNKIRVLDGEIMMQGRYIRLNEGSYVDLAIENGTQGYKRNDLIVARYTKNASTGVEECSLVVIKGTNAASDPSDPAYTAGDLLVDHDILNDMPLFRVALNSLAVETVTPLFSVLTSVPGTYAGKYHKEQHKADGADALSPADIGAVPTTRKVNEKPLSADVTLKSDDIKVPNATASSLGLNAGSTVDAAILALLANRTKISTGSYVGTGTVGESNPNTLNFEFTPAVVIVCTVTVTNHPYIAVFVNPAVKNVVQTFGSDGAFYEQATAWAAKSVSWYCSDGYSGSGAHYSAIHDYCQLNSSGSTYRWIAIG